MMDHLALYSLALYLFSAGRLRGGVVSLESSKRRTSDGPALVTSRAPTRHDLTLILLSTFNIISGGNVISPTLF